METLSTTEQVTQLLTESAPRMERVDAIVQPDDTSWVVAFDDDSTVLINWIETPHRLVLSAGLGHPSEARQCEVLQKLMSYNALWESTGGVRTARGGDEGELLLLYDWYPQIMAVEQFPVIIENFSAIAKFWEHFVTADTVLQDDFAIDPGHWGRIA